jgi:hypothetical protein
MDAETDRSMVTSLGMEAISPPFRRHGRSLCHGAWEASGASLQADGVQAPLSDQFEMVMQVPKEKK